jgi:hypothetical protein
MRRQLFLVTVILSCALCAVSFQRGPADGDNPGPYSENHSKMLGLMRTINTIEVSDHFESGAYQSWPELVERHSKDLNGWLVQNGLPQSTFAGLPEILPGWKLRLNLTADGRSYSVLLEDIGDKEGFALVSDERGLIREGKYIH